MQDFLRTDLGEKVPFLSGKREEGVWSLTGLRIKILKNRNGKEEEEEEEEERKVLMQGKRKQMGIGGEVVKMERLFKKGALLLRPLPLASDFK